MFFTLFVYFVKYNKSLKFLFSTFTESKLIRKTRNALDEDILESSDLIPSFEYPYEGDADYDADNSSFIGMLYPL